MVIFGNEADFLLPAFEIFGSRCPKRERINEEFRNNEAGRGERPGAASGS